MHFPFFFLFLPSFFVLAFVELFACLFFFLFAISELEIG